MAIPGSVTILGPCQLLGETRGIDAPGNFSLKKRLSLKP